MSDDMWADILDDLAPTRSRDTLPSTGSFRTLPEPDDEPVWRGAMKPNPFEVRQFQIRNKTRGVGIRNARFISGYTDASLHPPTRRAGWGLWLRDTHTRIIRCGPSPKWVRSSNDAELVAVFAAIWTAVSNIDTEKADILMIKTDNQHVAMLFGWNGGMRKAPRKIRVLDLLYRAYALCEEAGVHLSVSWVKGHRGTVDTPAYINTQVDKIAGEAMRTQRGWKRIITVGGSP